VEKFKKERKDGSKKWKDYTDEEIETVVAEMVNDMFQGINWDRLLAKNSVAGRAMTGEAQRVLRFLFYGSDRITAILNRHIKVITDSGNRWQYAKMLLRGWIMTYLVTNLLQYVFTGRFTWENQRGNELDLELDFLPDEKGNPIAINIMGTQAEGARAIMRPTNWVRNKMGIVGRTAAAILGRDGFHSDKNILREIWENNAPLPFSLQTFSGAAYDAMFSSGKKKKTGKTDLKTAAIRGGLEFMGFGTTYRTGKNMTADMRDVIKGNASINDYLSENRIKKGRKKDWYEWK
jgi:hypothetical protein